MSLIIDNNIIDIIIYNISNFSQSIINKYNNNNNNNININNYNDTIFSEIEFLIDHIDNILNHNYHINLIYYHIDDYNNLKNIIISEIFYSDNFIDILNLLSISIDDDNIDNITNILYDISEFIYNNYIQ